MHHVGYSYLANEKKVCEGFKQPTAENFSKSLDLFQLMFIDAGLYPVVKTKL